jgi:hypothetical protein
VWAFCVHFLITRPVCPHPRAQTHAPSHTHTHTHTRTSPHLQHGWSCDTRSMRHTRWCGHGYCSICCTCGLPHRASFGHCASNARGESAVTPFLFRITCFLPPTQSATSFMSERGAQDKATTATLARSRVCTHSRRRVARC